MTSTVLTVVGARPQFIKAFPVSDALRPEHDEVLVHTGQHYDETLTDVFFEELDIPTPEYNLGIGSGTHANQTAELMEKLDTVVATEEPDIVLVYGDTNSTLGAALVAAKRPVELAHVEAGVRSDNWSMPEEVNRVLTDRCSDYCFAPCRRAVETLAGEGITDGVYQTGDVTSDALFRVRDSVEELSTIVENLGYDDDEYILATVHRANNTDDRVRLANIMRALADAPKPVVLPAHPRTVSALDRADLLDGVRSEIELIEPVGYLDFVRLLVGADRVVTDSGGVQKEAFHLDTPCVTLREETEWIETVESGWNVLVGADPDGIERALSHTFEFESKPSPYGEGDAAVRIAEIISDM